MYTRDRLIEIIWRDVATNGESARERAGNVIDRLVEYDALGVLDESQLAAGWTARGRSRTSGDCHKASLSVGGRGMRFYIGPLWIGKLPVCYHCRHYGRNRLVGLWLAFRCTD